MSAVEARPGEHGSPRHDLGPIVELDATFYDYDRMTARSYINARIPGRGFDTRRGLLVGDRRPTGGSSYVQS